MHRIHLNDTLVLDPTMLEQSSKASALTILLEDIDLVSMNFDTVVLHDVRMMKHLHDTELILDLGVEGRKTSDLLEFDFLDRHK